MKARTRIAALAAATLLALGTGACATVQQSIASGQTELPTSVNTDSHTAKWSKRQVIQEATCLASGRAITYCEICRANGLTEHPDKKEAIPTMGHGSLKKQETGRVEATCTEPALVNYEYICSECGDVLGYEHGIHEGKALGHDWSHGYVPDSVCNRCGVSVNDVENPMMGVHQHRFTKKEVVIEPTCTTVGQEIVRCYSSDCDAEELRIIEPLNHSWSDGVCTKCGMQLEENN